MAGNWISDALGAAIFYIAATALVTAIPVIHIALGAVYLHDCPVAPLIPVYVMVVGILALVMMGLFVLNRLLCPAWSCQLTWTVSVFCLLFLCFVWFIFGSYQIYSVYPPNYNKNITSIEPNGRSGIYNTASDNKFRQSSDDQRHNFMNTNQTLNIANNQTLLKRIQMFSNVNVSVTNETDLQRFDSPKIGAAMAASQYCNRPLYLFVFWTTTMVYVFAAHALVIYICILGFMKFANVLSKF